MRILSVCERLGDNAYSWRVKNVLQQLRLQGNFVKLVENDSLSRQGWLSKAVHFPESLVRTLGELHPDSYDFVHGNGQATVYCLFGRFGRFPLVFDMHGLAVEEYLLQNTVDGQLAKVNPAYMGRMATDWSFLRLSDTIV